MGVLEKERKTERQIAIRGGERDRIRDTFLTREME